MKNTMKNFMEEVSKNKELQEKLKAISTKAVEDSDQKTFPDSALEEIIALAKEQGYALSKESFNVEKHALSDDELLAVAGGGSCACPVVGGGGGTDGHDGNSYGCGCVGYGQGGDGRAEDFNCLCPVVGGGDDYGDF